MSKIDCMAVLKALSEPTRMHIVRLLMKQPLGVNMRIRLTTGTQP